MGNEFIEALMGISEALQPVIEFAEGERKRLEERGWLPTAADAYALEMLLSVTKKAMGG